MNSANELLFWYWISERHRIYQKRTAGEPKPWTDDAILQRYKFTNAIRKLDRVSAWVLDDFIAPNEAAAADDELLFNVAWFRMFNWPETAQLIGWQKSGWRADRIARKVQKHADAGHKVFTGAYRVWSEGGRKKVDAVTHYCSGLYRVRKEAVFACSMGLQAAFDVLSRPYGVGGFMAYEIVSDLRWTRLLSNARDINTWANTGPGALRGLRRLYPQMTPKECLPAMRSLLARSALGCAPHVPQLELRDIEHSLCEFDKYCRVKFGEGRPRSMYPGEKEQ